MDRVDDGSELDGVYFEKSIIWVQCTSGVGLKFHLFDKPRR